MQENKLKNLRKKIIEDVYIKKWKEVWFYPKHNGVRGWLGTKNIMFVGLNPSYGIFPSKYTDFFYEQLRECGFGNAHLTDLIKTKVKNRNIKQAIESDFNEQKKYLDKEIEILAPKIIVVMGGQTQKMWFNEKDDRFVKMTHYSAIRFPKNKNKFKREMRYILKIYKTR